MKLKDKIVKEIKEDKNEYFSYACFDKRNMKDYPLMSAYIKDLIDVYDIRAEDAIDIVTALTH